MSNKGAMGPVWSNGLALGRWRPSTPDGTGWRREVLDRALAEAGRRHAAAGPGLVSAGHNHSAYGRRDAGVAARPLRPAANLLSGGSWPALKLSGSGPIGLLLLKTLAVSGEQNQPGNPKRAASSRNFRDAQGTARDMPGFAVVCTAERNYVSGAKRGASRARALWPPVSMQRRSDDSHTK